MFSICLFTKNIQTNNSFARHTIVLQQVSSHLDGVIISHAISKTNNSLP